MEGELIAQGASDAPIVFTSNVGASPGDWGYILFTDSSVDAAYDGEENYTSGSIIQYAVIEYGGGASVGDNAALRIDASSPFIDHTTVRHSDSDGLRVFNDGAPKTAIPATYEFLQMLPPTRKELGLQLCFVG